MHVTLTLPLHCSKRFYTRLGVLAVALGEGRHSRSCGPRVRMAVASNSEFQQLPGQQWRRQARSGNGTEDARKSELLSFKEEKHEEVSSGRRSVVFGGCIRLVRLRRRRPDHPDHRQGHDLGLLADRVRRRPPGRQGSRRQGPRTRRPVRVRHQRRDHDPRERGRRKVRRGCDRPD